MQDFAKEGAPNPQAGRQHVNLPNFPQNCMKLKEFGPRGCQKLYCVEPSLVSFAGNFGKNTNLTTQL